ncbi:MAG: rod shape-determining protein MreD [Actinobacteria bacterium]|nr:MAG: rod shape-determining protein MreD [Actinomycetota bacterium]
MEPGAVTRFGPRLAFVIFVGLTLHLSLFATARIGEVRPDVLLLIAVAGGIVGGAERGAVIGFVSGMAVDLFVHTPLGLSALAFSLVAFAVGTVQSSVIRAAWWIPPATAWVASAAGILLYALLGALIGRPEFLEPRVLGVAAGVATANALLAPPLVRIMAWALPRDPDRSYA